MDKVASSGLYRVPSYVFLKSSKKGRFGTWGDKYTDWMIGFYLRTIIHSGRIMMMLGFDQEQAVHRGGIPVELFLCGVYIDD